MSCRIPLGGLTVVAIFAQVLLVAQVPMAMAASSPRAGGALHLSGSIRLRYEMIDGQPRAGFNADDELLSLRTTVFGEYVADSLRIGAELYDSRAYLADARSPIGTGEVNTVEFVQAYGGVKASLFGQGNSAAAQLGRFTLNLGSRRLVAADDYRNTTNGYTGVRTDFRTTNGLAATFVYTLPQVRQPADLESILDNKPAFDRESFDLQLWGGYLSKPGVLAGAMTEIGYIGLAERDSPHLATRNRQLQTFSARMIREPEAGELDFEIEGIYQCGTIRASTAATAAKLDVSAWFVHADLGYTFPGSLKARLSVEFDHASGDRPGGAYGRFDTLFGMRRADLAPAGIYNAIGRANISTPGLRLEAAPTPCLDGFVACRPMWLAEKTDAFSTTNVRDATGRAGSFAGHQVEGRLRWWILPQRLRGEINGVRLVKGGFLERAPNAPRQGNAGYVSVSVTASF